MNEKLRYPTEEELEKIRKWESMDFHAIMEFVETIWEFKEWGFRRDENIYYLSTGGWSGNEEIIMAMRKNIMFWVLFWQQSRRGGHYIFAPLTPETYLRMRDIGVL